MCPLHTAKVIQRRNKLWSRCSYSHCQPESTDSRKCDGTDDLFLHPECRAKAKHMTGLTQPSPTIKLLVSGIYSSRVVAKNICTAKEQFIPTCINIQIFPQRITQIASSKMHCLCTVFRFGCNLSCVCVPKQMEFEAKTSLL